MPRYASSTSVSVEKSRAELETILTRYGATRFGYMVAEDSAAIGFVVNGVALRFVVPLPDQNDKRFWTTPQQRKRRTRDSALREWQQACRQRWRALVLVVKAKLEAVDVGILTFEEAFLPHFVLPDGKTVAETVAPQIAQIAEGRTPPLLPDMGRAS